MISIFDLAALLLTLSALFSWLNRRFLRMPHSIGLLVMGLLASLALVLVDVAFPGQHLYEDLTRILDQVDFTGVVMNGMLAFLLFAGALNLDLGALRDRAFAVAILSVSEAREAPEGCRRLATYASKRAGRNRTGAAWPSPAGQAANSVGRP